MTENKNEIEWQGVRYREILSKEQTGGAMSIVDSVSPPFSGPPRHIHHDADETFVLLSGSVEFFLEGETFVKNAGETAYIPRGKEHTFRSLEAPSRHLVILTPGGFEGFFEEMAAGQFQIPADMAKIGEIAAKYQMDFTGPPLGME